MRNEDYASHIPHALEVTSHPRWADLMFFVEHEASMKTKMLRRQDASIETIRYLQGVLAGLEFISELPKALKVDYQNFLKVSEESDT